MRPIFFGFVYAFFFGFVYSLFLILFLEEKFLVYILLAMYDSYCKLNKYVQYCTYLQKMYNAMQTHTYPLKNSPLTCYVTK